MSFIEKFVIFNKKLLRYPRVAILLKHSVLWRMYPASCHSELCDSSGMADSECLYVSPATSR